MTAPDYLADARFERDVRLLYKLGPQVMSEFLKEIGRNFMVRTAIDEILERYIDRLTPGILEATGGNRFPTAPIRLVVRR
jgi:hypothetical protein